jgi:hypothetical protein
MKPNTLLIGGQRFAATVVAAVVLQVLVLVSNAAPITDQAISPKTAGRLSMLRLPTNVPPEMAVWGWRESEFAPHGYESHIEMMARHSGVSVLTTTIRAPNELVTDEAVRAQIRNAAEYAARFGIKIAMDLDVRLARETFRAAYPDELQEMLRLREVPLKGSGEVTLSIPSTDLSDHYTFNATHYIPLTGRVVRIYTYGRTSRWVKPETLRDITSKCHVLSANEKGVSVSIPCDEKMAGKCACVMVAFAHLTPDVFAPHLLSFQRQILKSYRHVPLAGACKDEWGFPPCFDGNPAHNDYWYSRYMAQAYAKQTGGHDLIRDCLLMTYGETGREADRLAAINHFNELCRERNGAIETDFYNAVKSVWGADAVVATHPTWWPYPDSREFKKNGLDWWIVRRDWAQTDEITPYCVRTALAKKWGSPLWYNMYYSTKVADYQAEMWADALTGGRINFHPLWPTGREMIVNQERYRALLRGGLMRGDCRVRLLNFITRSPLDCPVAVIFGQPSAMNWAGRAYDDVGMKLSDKLWQAGYPADLIPTTEIWSGAVKVSRNGYVQCGPQRYRCVVLYHPDLDQTVTAEFLRRAAKGKTTLYRIGDWSHDFDGKRFDDKKSLPRSMLELADAKAAVDAITKQLEAASVAPQPRANRTLNFPGCHSVAPPTEGESRLIDGTHIIVSGVNSASGDPIQRTFSVNDHNVSVDAIGLVAVRLDKRGRLEALAAGGLKTLSTGKFKIDLPDRVDLALWHDNQGRFRGVLQGWAGVVPTSLQKLTKDWLRLSVPVPVE